MTDLSNISNSQLFVVYAQENLERWLTAIRQQVTHTMFGIGKIKNVEHSPKGVYIDVCFVRNQETTRQFTNDSLANSRFFNDMQLPINRFQLQEQVQFIEKEIAKKKRKLEEERQECARIEQQRKEPKRLQLTAERQKKSRELEEEKQERARREAEKQTLLRSLKEQFEQNFLNVWDFYQVKCSKYILFGEYEFEKNNYVKSWVQQVTRIAKVGMALTLSKTCLRLKAIVGTQLDGKLGTASILHRAS